MAVGLVVILHPVEAQTGLLLPSPSSQHLVSYELLVRIVS